MKYCHKCTYVCMSSILYSCRIVMKFEFSQQIFENVQISNFMKIRPLGTQLFHTNRWTDGRTDMTKLTVAFRNSANAPKRQHL